MRQACFPNLQRTKFYETSLFYFPNKYVKKKQQQNEIQNKETNIIIRIFNALTQFSPCYSMTYKAYKDSFWKIKPLEKFHTF